MTTDQAPLHLFEAYGIELEYMLVDADDMSVRPMADVRHCHNLTQLLDWRL